MIKDKATIPKVAKLQHLLNAVQGQAALRLKNIEITDSNFDLAWEKLLRRYDNARVRLFNNVEKLINLPAVRVRNVDDLNILVDKTEEAVRALKDLDCPIDQYDNWLVHCIVRKLDPVSRENWELNQQNHDGFSTYTDLRNFLENRIQTLEKARAAIDTRDHTQNDSSRSLKNTKRVSANSTQMSDSSSGKSNPTCIVCSKNHSIYTCFKFKNFSQSQRLELCKRKKLCLNCLQNSRINVLRLNVATRVKANTIRIYISIKINLCKLRNQRIHRVKNRHLIHRSNLLITLFRLLQPQ